MKKDVLNSFVNDHLSLVEKCLLDFSKDKQAESLHCLRVAIKKIKAAYAFAEHIFQRKFSTAKLRSLFKEAGKIREIQLNIRLLSTFPQPPKRLITQLKKEEEFLSQEFIANELIHNKSIKKFRKENKLPHKRIENKKITKYFDKIKSSLALQKNSDDLHRYRIRIKRMMHVYSILPVKLQNGLNIDIEKIDKLQQELGDWHDIHTAINYVSDEQVPKKLVDYITKMKNDESRQFEALYTSITSANQ